jgi:membrane AbrB-like protein
MERILTDLLKQAGGTISLFMIGWLGCRMARKLHWPAAAMLGSLLFLGVLNIAGVKMPFYKTPLSFFSKVLSGVILGQKINRSMVSVLKKMVWPAAFASFWMVMSSLLTGLLVFAAADGRLSLMTCLAASSAGGIAEMSIFAMSVGADVGVVAFFQSVRIVVLYATLPFSTSLIARHVPKNSMPSAASHEETHTDFTYAEIIRFAAVTCVVAIFSEKIGMPSGYMIGAMIGSGMQNVCTGKVLVLPAWLRSTAQICLSVTITVGLSPETVSLLMKLFLPLLVSVCTIQVMSFVLAWLMHRMSGWDVMTSVLATCPGGLSQVVFFAEDLHADPFVVGVFHAVRMVSIVLCVPAVAKLIVS